MAFLGFAQESKSISPEQPRIGLVLSGGGAKGFAHVGVLKVLEEAGIPVDYITGTSIGSIVGGFYAIGYDAKTIEDVVRNQNWVTVLSDDVKREYVPIFEKRDADRYMFSFPMEKGKVQLPAGLISGQNVLDLFSYLAIDYHEVTDFSQLPIPFLCIAADMETGKEAVLDHGFLPEAIRASMAVPTAFAPSEIDGRMLVDGGIINNFPVDHCLDMGADIIIGVDIQHDLRKKEDLKSIPDVVNQIIALMGLDRYEKNLEDVDVLIKPDIEEFSASSFDAASADILIKRGEAAARKVLPQLIRLRDSLHLVPRPHKRLEVPDSDRSFYIDKLVIEGDGDNSIDFYWGKLGIDKGERITLKEFREGIARIYGSKNFERVAYRFSGDDHKTVFLTVKKSVHYRLNVGAHYNSDERAAVLINTTIRNKRRPGTMWSADAKLSQHPAFGVRYTLDNGWKPGLYLNADFHDDALYFYEETKRTGEMNFRQVRFQGGVHSIFFNSLRMTLGAEFVYYDIGTIIGALTTEVLGDKGYLNYFFEASVDQLDRQYFPNEGWKCDGRFRIVTDDGFNFNDGKPLSVVEFKFQSPIRFSPRFSLLSSFNTRFVFGSDIPLHYTTAVGGMPYSSNYDFLIPFAGMKRMELVARNVAVAGLKARVRTFEKLYFSLAPSVGSYGSDERFFFDGSKIYGGSLAVGYDGFLGPVELSFSSSNIHKKITPYLTMGVWF